MTGTEEGAARRDRVVARIREALRTTPRPYPAGRREIVGPRPEAPDGDLLQRFVRACEGAQAAVSVVTGGEAARRRLDELLEEAGARTVVVSPDAAAAPWRCGSPSRLEQVRFVTRRAGSTEAREDVLVADVGVTCAVSAVADTGALVVLSSAEQHRLDSLLPPVHVALLRAQSIRPDLAGALASFSGEYPLARHSAIVLIRGPSRTADIELTLTIGVHGPRRMHVIVLDEEG